jgi:hypothetical protein
MQLGWVELDDAIELNHCAIIEFAPVCAISCEDIVDFALSLEIAIDLITIGNLATLAQGRGSFDLIDKMAARGVVGGHEYYLS